MYYSNLFRISLFACCSTAFVQPDATPAITLHVVVNDGSGQPVTGLQQQDFTVLDNKQPQKIVSFEAAGPGEAVETVIVLDAVNTGYSRVAYAREQIDKFLRQDGGRLARPLSIGIFTDSGLSVQPTPSTDGNALATFLDQQETGLRSITRSQGFYGAADRTNLSIRAVEEIASFETKRPGRKLVVWVSPGWPLLSGPRINITRKEQESIFDTIVAVTTDLQRAGITLYSADPLGTTDSGSLRTTYYEQFLKGVSAHNDAQFGNLALQVLATHSGGRVLYASNDVAAEIERCVRDANAYYTLAFEAPPAADDANDYHAIEVKLDQSHLKAQTLTGYYTRPQPTAAK